MIILFENNDLEALCTTERLQVKKLGQAARRLRSRLAELHAAANVSDLVIGSPHPLKGDRAGQFSLTIDGGRRLVFAPAHDPIPCTADGAIAWNQVSSIRIVYIGDYHD